jgi:hypothetical protein
VRIESFICQDGRVYFLRPPVFFDYGTVVNYLQLIKTWQDNGLFIEDKFIELKIIYPHVYELIDAFVNRINSDRAISLDSLTSQDLINLIQLYSELTTIKQQAQEKKDDEPIEDGIPLESCGDLENDFIGDIVSAIPNGMDLLLNLDYQSIIDVLSRHQQRQPESLQRKKEEQDKIKEEAKKTEYLNYLTQSIQREKEEQWSDSPPEWLTQQLTQQE